MKTWNQKAQLSQIKTSMESLANRVGQFENRVQEIEDKVEN
jgi:hypothetical protein